MAGLSESYDKVNIVVDCCGADEYLHAFSATALDGDMPLASNSDGYFPEERATGKHCIRGMEWQTEKTDWTRESSLAQLWGPNHFRTVRRLINVDSEFCRLQAQSPDTRNFSLL